jgi:hypothetical protein
VLYPPVPTITGRTLSAFALRQDSYCTSVTSHQ